jgi:hypothetical protein
MTERRFVEIQTKGEIKLINLDRVNSIQISERSITFNFLEKQSLMFTVEQLGDIEFKKLKDTFVGRSTVRPI